MSPWLRRRQIADRIVAVALGILVAPLVGVLGWIVRRESPGPAFVRVDRVGQNGRHFRMHKLRTMVADGDRGSARGSVITATDDSRITRSGRVLRATHLDELPQLLDVVFGGMALIGPRPEVPEFVDASDPQWKQVLQARPGIAGPTQIAIEGFEKSVLSEPDTENAYRELVVPHKLRLDAWYMEHAGVRLDAEVVVSLVQRAVAPGAVTLIEKRLRAQGMLPDAGERAT